MIPTRAQATPPPCRQIAYACSLLLWSVHVSVTAALATVAARPVGAAGGASPVVIATELLQAEAPKRLIARTW